MVLTLANQLDGSAAARHQPVTAHLGQQHQEKLTTRQLRIEKARLRQQRLEARNKARAEEAQRLIAERTKNMEIAKGHLIALVSSGKSSAITLWQGLRQLGFGYAKKDMQECLDAIVAEKRVIRKKGPGYCRYFPIPPGVVLP